MGNKLVSDYVKEKNTVEAEEQTNFQSLDINAEAFLFEKDIINNIYEQVKKLAGVKEPESWEKLFPIDNIQKNQDVNEMFMKEDMLQRLTENYTQGFSTPQSNCQMLKDNKYERYFKVHTDAGTKEYTQLQQKKYYLLYSLYQKKFETSSKLSDFFEYCDKFLSQPSTAQVAQIPELNVTANIIMDLLSPEMLVNTLNYYYERLSQFKPVTEIDQKTFTNDSVMNQTRDFLVNCIRDKKRDPRAVDLCFKILIRMGTSRCDPVDYLYAVTILDENPELAQRIDLRAEFDSLRIASGVSQDQGQAKNNAELQLVKGTWYKVLHQLKDDYSRNSFVCDQSHFYLLNGAKIIKFQRDARTLFLQDTNEDTGCDQSTMGLINSKLFVRKSKETPLEIYDCSTLQKASEAIEITSSEEEVTMSWMDKPDSKTGRFLSRSPIFSDGTNLYLVSLQRTTRLEDDQDSDEQTSIHVVVECFDSTNFKHIKSTTLYKNEFQDSILPHGYNKIEDLVEQFVMAVVWITNGDRLIIFKGQKIYLFDLKTGMRISKSMQQIEQFSTLCYDNKSNSIFLLTKKDNLDLNCITDAVIPAFKNSEKAGDSNLNDNFKANYESKFEVPLKKINVIERIIKRTKIQTKSIVIHDAKELVKATLLGNIASHCEQFQKLFQQVSKSNSDKESKFINIFRFPGATYLTSEMFECLTKLLNSVSHLRTGPKNLQNLPAQQSLLYLLQILEANFKALGFCGITLGHILDQESYDVFQKTYDSCVVAIVEHGYYKEFDYAPCQQLWQSIYSLCQRILSIELVNRGTPQIIQHLVKVFSGDYSEKQAENCSFLFQFLTGPQRVQKLLDADEFQDFQSVFETLSNKLTDYLTHRVSTFRCFEQLNDLAPESLIWVSFKKFQNALAQQALVQIDQIGARIKSNKAQNQETKKKKKLDEQNLQRSLKYTTTIFSLITSQLTSILNQVISSLRDSLKDKQEDFFNKQTSQQFNNYQKSIAQIIHDGSIQSFNLYVQVLPYLYSESHELTGAVMQDCVHFVQVVANLKTILRQNRHQLKGQKVPEEPEDQIPNKEIDEIMLLKNLDRISSQTCWAIGYVSFNYIQVKQTVLTAEDLKKETTQQKMERMLIESKLLSGGLENQYINLFSQEILDQVRQVLVIGGDFSLQEMIEVKNANPQENVVLNQVMHEGQNVHVDLLIKLLQFQIIRQQPPIQYAVLQGQRGLRVQLAAFAILLKFNNLTENLENLVDDIDLKNTDLEGLEGNQKLIKLRDMLMEDKLSQENLILVQQQYAQASKMRLWLTEKIKNLTNKIKVQQRDKYIQSLKKKDGKQGTQKDQNQQEEQIDTSMIQLSISQPTEESKIEEKPEEQKDEPIPEEDEDEIKLTQQDKDKLQEMIDLESQKSIEEIIVKIFEKAELMLKMNVPDSYKSKSKENNSLAIKRQPSYIKEDQKLDDDLTDKMKLWNMMQEQEGFLKSKDDLKNVMLNNQAQSILAILQISLPAKKIMKKFESVFLAACKRVAGLNLISKVVVLEDLPNGSASDLFNWMCSGLRNQSNQLNHYLTGVQGCGEHLERQIKLKFFCIYEALFNKIKACKDKQDIIRFLDAAYWKFRGQDHEMLANIQIFKLLRHGDGHRKNLIKRAWGRQLSQKVGDHNAESTDLVREVITTFEKLLLNIMSRLTESFQGTAMELKQGGTNVPKLERRLSALDVNASEKLVSQAFEVVFKEFDRYIYMTEKFEGVDQLTYITQRNYEKKNSQPMMEFLDELLFDEDEEEKSYQDQKEAQKKLNEPSKPEEGSKQETKPEGPSEPEEQIKNTSDNQDQEKQSEEAEEAKAQESDRSYGSMDEEQIVWLKNEKEKKAQEEAEAKVEEDLKEKLKQITEAEIKSTYKLYAENYLQRLLRLIEIFVSAASQKQYAMAMIQKIANPYMIFTLIRLLISTSARNKIAVIKIVQSLMQIKIPVEIFEKTLDLIKQSPNVSAIFNLQTELKFKSKTLNFFYKYLVTIRSAMWDNQDAQSSGDYEFSQEISGLIRNVLRQSNQKEWAEDLIQVQKQAMLDIKNLSEVERDCLFSIQLGADFERIAIGRQAINSQGQVFTVLGYSEQKINKDIDPSFIESHKLSSVFTDAKQKLFGLFYDDKNPDRQEIIEIQPFDAKLLQDLNQSDAREIALYSVLMDYQVITNLVNILTDRNEDLSMTDYVLKVQILKSITCLLQINPEFLKFVESNGILKTLIEYLQQLSSSKINDEQKQNELVPLTWLIAKATNIRAKALEGTQSLVQDQQTVCKAIENTQLLFTTTDNLTGEQYIQNLFLESGLNMNRVRQDQTFTVHFDCTQLKTRKAKSKVRNGLVFVDGPKLDKLDNDVLEILQSSQAILTHDVEVKSLFARIVAKATEKDSKWQWIVACTVFVVSKEDFDQIKIPQTDTKPDWLLDKSKSKVEIFFDELKYWGGIDTEKLMWHFCQLEDVSISNLKKSLPEILEKVQKEESEHQEKMQNFESNDNTEGLENEKKRRNELLASRAKAVEEKKAKILAKETNKSIVQQQSEKVYPERNGECDIPDILKISKADTLKFLEPAFEQIKSLDQGSRQEDKVKSEEAICKQYLQIITDFPKTDSLIESYKNVMQQLLVGYAKQTLLDLIAMSDLESITPSLLKDNFSQKQLSCFLKSSFNQAILTRRSTGQKSQVRSLKEMLRRLFKFCVHKDEQFAHKFVFEDILQAGILTLETLQQEKSKQVNAHFATEEVAIVQLNPYLLKFVVNLLLENSPAWFKQSKTYLPCLFTMCISFLVKFWDSKDSQISGQLLTAANRIVYFCFQNLKELAQSGVIQKIVNTPLLTRIVKEIDYKQQDNQFSEEQKQLLELYLGLIMICDQVQKECGVQFENILEITPGISEAKRSLKIVQEKQNFQFLKYYIFHQQLSDSQKKLMNETISTQHNHYDVKTLAKYNIDQVERLSVKISEKCEFKPLQYFGLGTQPTWNDIITYNVADWKAKEWKHDFNRSNFYINYPVKYQMVVAMGEDNRNRAGVEGSLGETALHCFSTEEIKPIQVASSKNATAVITQDNTIYITGQRWGSDHDDFKLVEIAKDEKCKKVFSGSKCIFVICESGKCFYVGTSKDFALPNDSSQSKFKEFKVDDADKIIDIACGNHFNVFVTEQGKIWGSGKVFQQIMGLDSEVAVKLPLPQSDMFVTRAWASRTREQNMCLIEVKDGDRLQLYSIGKNEKGLLGQGGKIKECKTFTKLEYDSTNIQFKQISIMNDHALAIDQNGTLWAWGSNSQFRSGFTAELNDGVYAPTKVPFVEGQVVKVSAGLDHSLVQVLDTNGKKHLYSLGKEESNFKHLGCSKEQASESVFREMIQFNDYEIIDFQASHRYNMIITAAEENPTFELYEHKIDNKTVQGLLHAYQVNGVWNYMSSKEYQTKSQDLPDVCIAFKCPIKDMDKVLTKLILNIEVEGEIGNHGELKSSLSSKLITGPRYAAVAKINNDMINVDLSESDIFQTNKFDVNPLIYFRLTKQSKQAIPALDLKVAYTTTNKWGYELEVIPDTSYMVNDKLLNLFKDEFKELCDTLSKFPANCEREFIVEFNKLLNSMGDKDHNSIDPKTEFDVTQMKFAEKSPLKKISDTVKRQYLILLWRFNQFFVRYQPFQIKKAIKAFRGYKGKNYSVSNLFNQVKSLILTQVKLKFVNQAIEKLPTRQGDYLQVHLKRQLATKLKEEGQIDHTGEFSLFGQLFQIFKAKSSYDCFLVNGVDDRVLRVNFENEEGIDAGGPYRELITSLGEEFGVAGILPLIKKSQNQKTNSGDCRECFVLDSTANSPTHQAMFIFLGVWIGHAFRTKSCIPINWAPLLWKQINNEELQEADLISVDTNAYNQIKKMRKDASELSEREFNEIYSEQFFEATLSNSQRIELCPNGAKQAITKKNLEEYAELYFKARFNEGSQQVAWLQQGIEKIVPTNIISMLEWEEIEIRVSGEKTVDVEKLKSITEYENCSASTKQVKWFWNIMSRMTEADKCNYLRFVWGRSRMPSDLQNLANKHTIYFDEGSSDVNLPTSHTCFFQIDLPNYVSEESMEKKIMTALNMCGGSIENR